jgi:hypothetical protein
MIWLRHELWEYNDGLGYRLASRTGTDEAGTAHREGTLRHVFYAPSPAAAKAQYWALRQLGPIIPSRFESDEPFTLAQLQAQLAQFPDDATLHGQPALHPDEDVGTPAAAPIAAVPVAGSAEPEHEAPESLEPWPVVAHSEPTSVEEAVVESVIESEPAAAESAVREDAVAEAVEEHEPVSNVVPIRIAAANDVIAASDAEGPMTEPRSREMAAVARHPAASGALGLALAELGPAAAASGALALALAELEPTPHTLPDDDQPASGAAPLALVASHSTATGDGPPASDAHVAEPLVPEPAIARTGAIEPLVPEPVAPETGVVEPLVPEPVAAEVATQPDPLGPITAVATNRGKRRKSGFFGGLIRFLMLLIVLGAVIVGVGIATGYLDGPTLLAQARALPDQTRNLSIVRDLLPG